MKNNKLKGYTAGISAAVAYGTNPLGALILYQHGLNPSSVIFYRFVFAVIILFAILKVQKIPLKISVWESKILSSLGVIFAFSALSLYTSFNYLDSGIASAILFAYPIMVAVIMALFFKEKASVLTIIAIVLSTVGIILLYQVDKGMKLSLTGVILVLISSLTYAVYIVVVNRTKISLPPFKMTFYIMIFASLTVLLYSFLNPSNRLMFIPDLSSLLWLLFAALVPTIIAMTLLNIGIMYAGSTPTAIMGALEPVTAVIISVTVFDGVFTLRLIFGIVLILFAVLLLVVGKTLFEKHKYGNNQTE